MQVTIKGKNFDVSDRLKEYADRKVGKLSKYFNHILSATIEFADEAGGKKQNARKAEITLNAAGQILRAEVVGSSFYTSLDSAADKLERQLRKFKTRLIDSRRGNGEDELEAAAAAAGRPDPEDELVRIKRFSLKPMTPEEAVLQMELSNHDFYLFRVPDSNQVAAVYRRKSGGFGMLVPDE
jgi:putative sigma-54 modulation protein